MGYECLLLTDCCGATDPKNHDAAISMIQKQGGGELITKDFLLRAEFLCSFEILIRFDSHLLFLKYDVMLFKVFGAVTTSDKLIQSLTSLFQGDDN